MKVKIFILPLFLFTFLTDAVEVTNEDINSPLVSYLLAKVQQLEAKMMVRPNIRNTRKATDKPTKAPVVADNKQCNCPPSVVTYIRWGNSTCPYGADTIYSGVVAGSSYGNEGAAVNPLCLPPDPQYLLHQAGYQNWVPCMEQSMNHIVDHWTTVINVMYHVLCVRFIVVLTR